MGDMDNKDPRIFINGIDAKDYADYYMNLMIDQEKRRREIEKELDNTFNEGYAKEYANLLRCVNDNDKSVNETTMQDFLERHTALMPTPFMLNHQLHFNSFISKFPVGPWFTDFTYLTKSTVEWWVVLMEIENPHKKLFKGNIDHAVFTAEYTQSRQQLRDWKSYIDDHKTEVIESLSRFRKPLSENKVSFKYVMVMGRRSEIENSEARRRAIAEENSNDLRIITYDTLLSDYGRERRTPPESIVLTMYQGDRFKCKYLPYDKEHSFCEPISTDGLLAYMKSEDIIFTREQIAALKEENYEMDSWLAGEPLTINHKYTKKGYSKKVRDTLPEDSLIRKLHEAGDE